MDKEYAQKILEQTKRDYNLISQRFSSTRTTRNIIWKDLEPLLNYTKTGDKVLDAGCGNGRLYGALKEKNINYFGIDNSGELVKIAKGKFPQANFQTADILSIPFPDDFFDKVYCIAALHHIPSEEFRLQAMAEMKRVLKPDGLLIVTVWNLWQKRMHWSQVFAKAILKAIGKTKLDPKDIFTPWKSQNGQVLAQRYVHAFTRKELKNLAKEAGFKVKETGVTFRPELRDNNIYLIAEK